MGLHLATPSLDIAPQVRHSSTMTAKTLEDLEQGQ
jgi:hypothetical protein